MIQITATERRVLQNLHIHGHMGKCGSLNKTKRLALLRGLIDKGLLTKDVTLTKLGREVSSPMYEDLQEMHEQDARMPEPIRAMLYNN